ncbi:hypothetical protein GUITHDRAFT_106448 [Guillardia theta CCMP2712]|uniref:tRNA-intron lyase n=1 Tax=Guillardia theta (strain CCMP2712) TaxID=905079 RepID=L1JHX0_GUITC|nr:hypothetical protein GUITHDRAFT_106448 [Guillardia theta CCMP2712]EKX47902.1 hypothetical protein GUITHDRAFT_106448 [Guillardia theta CCMP2712]|mmetsp:Transcript_1617/g.4911  ORF Transcript_1617/g.4911 Transcript_1617/m.4911 type:complete len:210 (+) Transcript_1617:156-785(+)|eukprot:XP_005834882.1 hypothetical protein GUITHDRAFT_106448 [Guillardia theta CCMP2712]
MEEGKRKKMRASFDGPDEQIEVAQVLDDWVKVEKMNSGSEDAGKNLFMSLEEAFYKAFILHELQIRAQGQEHKFIDRAEAWKLFSERSVEFQRNFIVYHHYSQREWRLIQGTKYGCSFLLYPKSESSNDDRHKHAPYAVQILPDGNNCMTWLGVQRSSRLAGQVSKELIIASVDYAATDRERSAISFEEACQAKVREIKVARWEPGRDR